MADEPQIGRLLQTVAELSYCNPFSTRRIALERSALGSDYRPAEGAEWNAYIGSPNEHRNTNLILERTAREIAKVKDWLAVHAAQEISNDLREVYAAGVLFFLYYQHRKDLSELVAATPFRETKRTKVKFYPRFAADVDSYFNVHREFRDQQYAPEHLFALAFQISRAFFHIHQYLIGVSAPMQKLRERVWESIFTHDLRRYWRSMHARMGDLPTIILGPSGTGKELVARAVGLSRYIPFDSASSTFKEEFALSFYPLNLAAFPTTLIESELFGHCRGAFTGAVSDRKGWLELCGPLGSVFLDEIAEIEETVQVKLLRVLETREFQKMGGSESLPFQGKLISATNRDIGAEIGAGSFREDLYYRLCADQIETPSLHERIAEKPEELPVLIEFLLKRWCDDGEVPRLSEQLGDWIEEHIGPDYGWPGNVRELDQCLRNLVIHGDYRPRAQAAARINPIPPELWARIENAEAPAEELIGWYCRYAYGKLKNFELAGKRLGLDRRTVRARV